MINISLINNTAEGSIGAQERAENKYDILIVDNNANGLKLLHSFFAASKYTCKSVSTGTEAINELKFSKPKVVLLDTNLPDIKGFKICKVIKRSNKFKNTRVFYITSESVLEVDKTMKKANADGVFYKPYSFSEFDILKRYI